MYLKVYCFDEERDETSDYTEYTIDLSKYNVIKTRYNNSDGKDTGIIELTDHVNTITIRVTTAMKSTGTALDYALKHYNDYGNTVYVLASTIEYH